jgi:hypothetical protein
MQRSIRLCLSLVSLLLQPSKFFTCKCMFNVEVGNETNVSLCLDFRGETSSLGSEREAALIYISKQILILGLPPFRGWETKRIENNLPAFGAHPCIRLTYMIHCSSSDYAIY